MRIKTSTISLLKTRLFKKYLVLVCAVPLVALIVFEMNMLKEPPAPKPYTKSDYAAAKAHWAEEIENHGTLKAYERFKNDTLKESYGTAHTLAHIFGELIYETDGLVGFSVCDSSFSMGCFHSFFGRAIDDHGVDIVYKLDSDCEKEWGSSGLICAHGIGHGLLTHLGDERVERALEICSELIWKEPLGGCSGGVFMEHDFQTMRQPIHAQVRAFNPETPYAPCDKISRYKEACYFSLGQWWFSALNQDRVRMGELCADVKDDNYRKNCGRGIGGIIGPHEEFNTLNIVNSCSLMPNDEIEVLCLQGAAWSYKGEPTVAARAAEPCVGMKDEDYMICTGGSFEKGDRL